MRTKLLLLLASCLAGCVGQAPAQPHRKPRDLGVPARPDLAPVRDAAPPPDDEGFARGAGDCFDREVRATCYGARLDAGTRDAGTRDAAWALPSLHYDPNWDHEEGEAIMGDTSSLPSRRGTKRSRRGRGAR